MKWARPELSNVVETVAVVTALKRIVRDLSLWGVKLWVAPDSLGCIGAISKGRSSKKRLLVLARQVAALQLASGVRVLMRFTSSERNWADGPSRGQVIGYFDMATGKVVTKVDNAV